MSSQLKPCPFCGSAGREVIRFYEEGAATSIRCQTCKVVTAPFLHIPEAVAAWNTRPGEGAAAHDLSRCPNCERCIADLREDNARLRASGIAAMRKAEELRQQRDELARTVLAVAYPVGMSQHVCQLCLGVRGAHADGCPAARATAHLHEGK